MATPLAKVKLKVKLGEELRLLSVERGAFSYTTLLTRLHEDFPDFTDAHKVTYVDTEGDEITVRSDSELIEFFDSHPATRPLRMVLLPPEHRKDVSAKPPPPLIAPAHFEAYSSISPHSSVFSGGSGPPPLHPFRDGSVASIDSGDAVPGGQFEAEGVEPLVESFLYSAFGDDNTEQLITEKEEVRVVRKWTKGQLLGRGAFGEVYLGMDGDTGELLAIKQIPLGSVSDGGSKIDGLRKEIELLSQLKHENIVRYYGTEWTGDLLNIFLEYVPGGSIAKLLSQFGSFSEPVIRVYTRQLLLGLRYLHAKNVVHRDIKGANILVDTNGCIKLADFGASRKVAGMLTMSGGAMSLKGTPYYMAPEVIRQSGHGRRADIWSVGCTVLEMITGKPPWSHLDPVAALYQIASARAPPSYPEDLSPAALDFLNLCFRSKPDQRPAAEVLLQHPFVADESFVGRSPVRPRSMSTAESGFQPDPEGSSSAFSHRTIDLAESIGSRDSDPLELEGDRIVAASKASVPLNHRSFLTAAAQRVDVGSVALDGKLAERLSLL